MTPLIEYDKKITQLIAAGRYDEALWIAEEELCYAESSYGHEHLETAKVLNTWDGFVMFSIKNNLPKTIILRLWKSKSPSAAILRTN